MPVTLKSNEYWGRRAGFFDTSIPKGMKEQTGNAIRLKKWGNGVENKDDRDRAATRGRKPHEMKRKKS